jgi:hypothetical protein
MWVDLHGYTYCVLSQTQLSRTDGLDIPPTRVFKASDEELQYDESAIAPPWELPTVPKNLEFSEISTVPVVSALLVIILCPSWRAYV